MRRPNGTPENERVERIMFCLVVGVMPLVALLIFFFSFGNVGSLGVGLGVEHDIAFLTGPAIDLSVAGLVLAASFLSSRGWSERQLWPVHFMAALCGLAMIALNDGNAIYEHHWRLAAFDSVGPMLLIGWCAIGPWLLRQLVQARRVKPATHETAAARAVPQRSDAAAHEVPQTPQQPAVPHDPAPEVPQQQADAAPPQQDRAAGAPQQPAAAETDPQPDEAHAPDTNGVTRLVPKDDRIDIIIELIARHGTVSGTTVGEALGKSRDTGIRAIRDVKKLPDFAERVAQARTRLREAGHPVSDDPADVEEPDRELVDA